MALNARPSFIEALVADYKGGVSHTFTLHGGIFDYTDYPEGDLTVVGYLMATFARQFVVALYSPDRGIEFPNDVSEPENPDYGKQRGIFEQAVGLTPEKLEQNSMAAMMRGAAPAGGTTPADLPRAPSEAIPLLLRFVQTRLENGKRPCIIMERLDLIAPPADKSMISAGDRATLAALHRIGTDRAVYAAGGISIMLTPTLEEVHPDLRSSASGIRSIEIEAPDFDQRLDFIRRKLARYNTDKAGATLAQPALWLEGITDEQLAALVAGLYRRHIEDMMLRAIDQGGALTRELALKRKREQIAAEYSGSIQVVEPEFGLEAVGGHGLVVDYFRQRVIPTIVNPELRDEAPTGVLLMGPSGTGKTHITGCLAREAGVNFIIAKPEAFRDKYVGGSEAKTAKFFAGVNAMAPCFVLFDEADQKLRRGEGGASGADSVENNIFASMLEFLSDPSRRGRVVAFAATNRPDNMDPALKRPGRFDTKVPLLPPQTVAERIDVLTTLVRRYLPGETSQLDLTPIAERTEAWTQAELEALVKKARTEARVMGVGYQEAFDIVLSTMRSATQDIETMTLLALAECDDARLVPEAWRSRVGTVDKKAARRAAVATLEPTDGRGARDIDLGL